MAVLILYYSYEGNTHRLAEYIHSQLGYDIVRLQPKKEMKQRGFSKYYFGGRDVFMKQTPALKPIDVNLADYEAVIVGTPVWAWTFAPPIRTIVAENWLRDKRIYYLYTHQGGCGGVEKKAKAAFEPANKLVSCMGVSHVAKNFENIKQSLIDWAKQAQST